MPRYGFEDLVGLMVDDKPRAGRVVGVFLDGLRAANHLRCFRCDHQGAPEMLAVYPGYCYLLVDLDSEEFIAREGDLEQMRSSGRLIIMRSRKEAAAKAAKAAKAAAKVAAPPSKRQVAYLVAIRQLVSSETPTTLKEIRRVVGVRSIFAVVDTLRRLESKGLVDRLLQPLTSGGVRSSGVVLTPEGERWAIES